MIQYSEAYTKLRSVMMLDAFSKFTVVPEKTGSLLNYTSLPAIPAVVVARENDVAHSDYSSVCKGIKAILVGLLLSTNSFAPS